MALTKDVVNRWNDYAPDLWRISPRVKRVTRFLSDPLEPHELDKERPGDRLYDEVTLLRNTLTPENEWPSYAREFFRNWKEFMEKEEVVDFPGMLELALERRVVPVQRIELLLVDEAQDLNPLQLALVEYWSSLARETYYIGDDDQAIYGFMGANGTAFLRLGVAKEIVLSQSYRVPARIQAVAERISSYISERAPKVYKPRPGAEGEVRRGCANPARPHVIVEEAIERVKAGKTVLILAPTRKGLEQVKKVLVERYGYPYANPYAWSRNDLNLFPDSGNGTPGWKRVEAFLRPKWTWWDLEWFVPYLRAMPDEGVFVSKESRDALLAKAELQRGQPVELNELAEYFTSEAMKALASRNTIWLEKALIASAPKGMRKAVQVAQYNPDLVTSMGKAVWIGTIHSVKGGEADSVFLFPYITYRMSKTPRDDLHRLFYVAVTRAKEELVVAESGAATKYPYLLRP